MGYDCIVSLHMPTMPRLSQNVLWISKQTSVKKTRVFREMSDARRYDCTPCVLQISPTRWLFTLWLQHVVNGETDQTPRSCSLLHELLNMKPDSDFNRNNLSCQHELSRILLRIIALCPEITLNADRIRTITALMLQLCKETKCMTCMWHMALKMSHLCNTSAPKPPPGEYCSFFYNVLMSQQLKKIYTK